MNSSFGNQIERMQAKEGISLNELARKSGFSRQSLYRIKKSKRPHPTTVHKIANALGVEVDIFLPDEG